eukprot:symbB.v1.2.028923.t1/scaffold3113.1/size63308/4
MDGLNGGLEGFRSAVNAAQRRAIANPATTGTQETAESEFWRMNSESGASTSSSGRNCRRDFSSWSLNSYGCWDVAEKECSFFCLGSMKSPSFSMCLRFWSNHLQSSKHQALVMICLIPCAAGPA